ncbi:hypothetical protein M8494_15035 [Serratia ureilytica]
MARVADSLGLELNLVPPRGRLAAGHHTGKYDAAIFNIAVTKLRKTKIRLRHLSGGHAGAFTSNPPATSPRSTGRRTSPGCGSSSDPAPIRKTYCWDGIRKPRRRAAAGAADLRHRRRRHQPEHSVRRADAFFGPHSTGAYKARADRQDQKWSASAPAAYVAVTTKKATGW